MILHNDSTEITTIGDIQENQVSIDARNINHIVTILSSNLYSNPVESFLRETISNAVDSHTEAGVTEPIIMTITEDTVAIRDFGTGISPERFKEIYLNIGSSTKRESNDYIGSFGIGRFSALSCSSLVNVTSIYNGKAYYYLMTRNANKLSIDLINTIDSTERNGVEVKIPINSASKYLHAINSLIFIPNLYIDCEDSSAKIFNERTITDYKTFKVCNIHSEGISNKILIGNIIYNLKDAYIPASCSIKYANAFKRIYPKFEIGELDVTPNREELLYSDRTIKAIKDRFIEVSQELTELIDTQYADCGTDIMSYLYTNVLERRKNLRVGTEDIYIGSSFINLKYKDRNFSNNLLQALDYLVKVHIRVSSIYNAVKNDVYRGDRDCDNDFFSLLVRNRWITQTWKEIEKRKFLVLPSTKGITGKYFYGYLRTKYPKETFLITSNIVKIFFKTKLRYAITQHKLDKKDRADLFFVIDEFIKALPQYCVYDDIFNDPNYKEYKKTMVSPTVKIASHTTVYYHGRREYRKTDASYEDVKRAVNTEKEEYYEKNPKGKFTTIIAIEGDPYIEILSYLKKKESYLVVAVAKTNEKWLNNFSKEYVRIEEFKKPTRQMSLLYTSRMLRGLDNWNPDITYKFDPYVKRLFSLQDMELIKYFESNYNRCYYPDSILTILETEVFPKCTIDTKLIQAYNRYNELYQLYTHEWELCGYTHKYNELFAYLCMKKGLFRINNKTYQTIKQLLKHETN